MFLTKIKVTISESSIFLINVVVLFLNVFLKLHVQYQVDLHNYKITTPLHDSLIRSNPGRFLHWMNIITKPMHRVNLRDKQHPRNVITPLNIDE